MIILVILYWAAGYWATGVVLYEGKIVFQNAHGEIFMKRLINGLVFGWFFIPVALIKRFFHMN